MDLFLLILLSISILHGTYGNKVDETCVYVDYYDKEFDVSQVGCPDNNICNANRTFHTSYILFPPYYYQNMEKYKDPNPIHDIIRQCCGTCARFNKKLFTNITEVSATSINSSDFIYPVLAGTSTNTLHGYHYIPVIDVPSLLYITKKQEIDLIEFICKVYPITVVSILVCLVSGFICWLLETWRNKEEFPREFMTGWFDGFWWSFISMTTVGYGDKSPRSIVGRLFSVIWISIGIITYGLLSGIVYAEVNKINSPPPPDMNGVDVGVLLYRDYDASVVAANGGKLFQNKDIKPENFYSDVIHLIGKLERKEIGGFVLDKYTALIVMIALYDKHTRHLIINSNANNWEPIKDPSATVDFFLDDTMRSVVPNSGEGKFTYGMLVKHDHDYKYFKDVIEHKRLHYRTLKDLWVAFMLDYIKKDLGRADAFYFTKNQLFSHDSTSFLYSIIAIAGMIGIIALFGIGFEIKRRCGTRNVSEENVEPSSKVI